MGPVLPLTIFTITNSVHSSISQPLQTKINWIQLCLVICHTQCWTNTDFLPLKCKRKYLRNKCKYLWDKDPLTFFLWYAVYHICAKSCWKWAHHTNFSLRFAVQSCLIIHIGISGVTISKCHTFLCNILEHSVILPKGFWVFLNHFLLEASVEFWGYERRDQKGFSNTQICSIFSIFRWKI
jgi:hypothetical protein